MGSGVCGRASSALAVRSAARKSGGERAPVLPTSKQRKAWLGLGLGLGLRVRVKV